MRKTSNSRSDCKLFVPGWTRREVSPRVLTVRVVSLLTSHYSARPQSKVDLRSTAVSTLAGSPNRFEVAERMSSQRGSSLLEPQH